MLIKLSKNEINTLKEEANKFTRFLPKKLQAVAKSALSKTAEDMAVVVGESTFNSAVTGVGTVIEKVADRTSTFAKDMKTIYTETKESLCDDHMTHSCNIVVQELPADSEEVPYNVRMQLAKQFVQSGKFSAHAAATKFGINIHELKELLEVEKGEL